MKAGEKPGTGGGTYANFEVIPAIDIIGGKCVRLSQGDYSRKTVYDKDPVMMALEFEDIGIRRLHVVDLEGAKLGKVVNLRTLEKIAARTKLVIDFGGGIKSDESIRSVFDSGAAIATLGSVAVKEKELFFSWLDKYGAARILLGADVRNKEIMVSGWLENTGIPLSDFLTENISRGVKTVFCTDISKDGLLQGPALELYRDILDEFPQLGLIASGGVSSIKDLRKLREVGCSGVILGKAIYENKITMEELKTMIRC
jgi:phosphoribosylformimino-5-aminoimidazole carboxamide ribotide isomerase